MSIRFHLWIGSGAAVLGILALGLLGIYGLKYTFDSLQTVYEDRMAPLELVRTLSKSYMVQVQDATLRMHNGEITNAEGRADIQRAQEAIEKSWRLYREHNLSVEEQAFLGSIQLSRDAADQEIDGIVRFLEVMEAQGNGLLAGRLDFILGSLDATTRPIGESLDRLSELHLKAAKVEFIASEKRFVRNLVASIFLLVISAGFAIWAAIHLNIQVGRQLKEILEALAELQKGNFSMAVPSHPNDELGQIGEGINRLVSHLRRMNLQVNSTTQRIQQVSAGLPEQLSKTTEHLQSFAKRLKLQGEAINETIAMQMELPSSAQKKERLLQNAADTSLRGYEGLLQIATSISLQQDRVREMTQMAQELQQNTTTR